MELVPERLRGEIARFDITDKTGKVVVQKDKRINAKHIRDMEAAGMKRIAVTEDYLLGRVLANNVVDPETGEIVAAANDELTEERLEEAARSQRAGDPHDLHQRPGPGPVHLQHAAHRRDRRPAGGAHRHLPDDASRASRRPKTRSRRCSSGLFFDDETYDLSRVGRMKVNSRFGAPGNHRADDAEQRRHHRHDEAPGRVAQRPRRDRRHRPPRQSPRALRRRTGREPVPCRVWCA